MNQFRLDLDATRCAQAHQDAHCGKMLLELVQQLCGAFAARDWVFALALPKQYMVDVNEYTFSGTAAVMAYRNYYRAEKRGYWRKSRDPAKPSTWVPAKWTRRDPPEWF